MKPTYWANTKEMVRLGHWPACTFWAASVRIGNICRPEIYFARGIEHVDVLAAARHWPAKASVYHIAPMDELAYLVWQQQLAKESKAA